MKNIGIAFAALLIASFQCFGQSDSSKAVTDNSTPREFMPAPIRVEGEVENSGVVDLSTLPLRSVLVKELGVDDSAGQRFRGAFVYSGYSLYDILKSVKIEKLNEKEFSPTIDLYVIVENDNSQRTVVSWGEIFSANDRFRILVSKNVEAINPSKVKVRWHLPARSRLICADDLTDVRFIPNPTKIIVRSFAGSFTKEKPKGIYSPGIEVVTEGRSFDVRDIDSTTEQRTYSLVGYGHGMGYKGVQSVIGYVLRKALAAQIKLQREDLKSSIAVFSAKDGYRAVFSASEIFNRGDNREFLLVDQKDSRTGGRYTLFAAPDFFVDRNVKAIEKIEIVKTDSLR